MLLYAVHVTDLVGLDPFLGHFLTPLCQHRQTVNVEPHRIDGIGLVLECPEEQADAIIQIIRKKYDRNRLRCYRGSGSSWKRL